MADALQSRQHLADDGAPSFERLADAALVFVERFEPRFGRGDLRFDAADAAGGIDQVLVELAAVGADLFDLALERGFGFDRFSLRVTRGLEVLVVLFEGVELFRLAVLRDLRRTFLRQHGGEHHRQSERQRRDKRGARIESPKANHFSHVTPADWDGKTIV